MKCFFMCLLLSLSALAADVEFPEGKIQVTLRKVDYAKYKADGWLEWTPYFVLDLNTQVVQRIEPGDKGTIFTITSEDFYKENESEIEAQEYRNELNPLNLSLQFEVYEEDSHWNDMFPGYSKDYIGKEEWLTLGDLIKSGEKGLDFRMYKTVTKSEVLLHFKWIKAPESISKVVKQVIKRSQK